MLYKCKRCGYETALKTNIKTHFNRKNLCELVHEDITYEEQLKMLNNDDLHIHKCSFCTKSYTSKQGLKAHVNKFHANEAPSRVDEMTQLKETIENLQKQIQDLQQTHIQNNTTVVNNTTINVVVEAPLRRNFGDENIEHITEEAVKKAILNLRKGAVELVHKVHYDPEVPENNNIAFKSAKSKQLYIVQDGTWKCAPINTTMEDLARNTLRLIMSKYGALSSDNTIVENEQIIHSWMNEVNSGKGNAFWKLKQELLSMIQNKTEAYNPVHDDRAKIENIV